MCLSTSSLEYFKYCSSESMSKASAGALGRLGRISTFQLFNFQGTGRFGNRSMRVPGPGIANQVPVRALKASKYLQSMTISQKICKCHNIDPQRHANANGNGEQFCNPCHLNSPYISFYHLSSFLRSFRCKRILAESYSN